MWSAGALWHPAYYEGSVGVVIDVHGLMDYFGKNECSNSNDTFGLLGYQVHHLPEAQAKDNVLDPVLGELRRVKWDTFEPLISPRGSVHFCDNATVIDTLHAFKSQNVRADVFEGDHLT
jgi:hypothetical protein